MGDVISIKDVLEEKNFDVLCGKVQSIQDSTGEMIRLAEGIDPQIRTGIVIKTLVSCIRDGLVKDDEQMEVIVNWLKSEYEKHKRG